MAIFNLGQKFLIMANLLPAIFSYSGEFGPATEVEGVRK
jgi:hypothetical protein